MKNQNLMYKVCVMIVVFSEKLVHPVPGDYVLVSFKPTGKAKCKVDHTTGQSTFIFKEDDESSFPESDIVKILPLPYVTGTSSRQKKFVFPINLNRWNLY